ncbi:AraC family transcriptional regulator [Glycomyces niveus]|uniref:Helix-turn-helix transcriptional regulator n=1 Tax=Glycomyces niveus TaxID=2820287 RepID=A0ABS3TZR0_9ACTN|nr:AraC family transcriptional regulator [Glycomyces sp. NEAU-S30]MBO3731990.1 helix-turn-helix transcriptional regulator [Glycomyces sp. NEAU-S30]
MRTVALHLDGPPEVVNSGVGVHGLTVPEEKFLLPDLWQIHLHDYEAEIELGGTAHPVKPGYVSLIPAGVESVFRYRGRSANLHIHARIRDRGAPHTVPVMQDAGPAAPVLAEMFRQVITAEVPARANAEAWALLWRFTRLDPGPGAGHHRSVEAALAYVEEHLPAPITVPEIAAAVGLSHNHLTRLFHTATGTTVVAHVRRRRLERARHLLLESTLSIPAVAAAVGIADLQAFNKACRRELGASPRALREAARKL